MTKVLCLRTCDADFKAYGGFQWPSEGAVSAPDWQPTKQCGRGLHGLLWGAGDALHLSSDESAKWMVVETDAESVIDLEGKVKFPSCVIVHVGDKSSAVAYIQERAPAGTPVVYGTATAGAYGTATAGAYGTATAGEGGTATAGHRGTATAGHHGTATAGYAGTATAGDRGTATAGAYGTATAGEGGTATAGEGGAICVMYWCEKQERYRRAYAEVDGETIKPGVAYHVVNAKLVEKAPAK